MNNFAVSTGDIAEGLARCSSALADNGVQLHQSMAMVMGANETIQDASKVGNSLKTMTMRLNGVTYSMKEGQIQSNKTASALKDLAGIEVVNWDTNEVKDTFTILSELASKWDTFNDVQRNGVADALGGAHHLNTLSALMSNWETVNQYVREYNEGFTVGSAQKEKLHSPYVEKSA